MADNKLQRTINSNQKTLPYVLTPDTTPSTDGIPPNESLVHIAKTAAGDNELILPALGGNTIQEITVVMVQKEAGSGNYTVSCYSGLIVTFSAVGQSASFAYDSVLGEWVLKGAPQGAAVA